MTGVSAESDAFYEWLLSDHPWRAGRAGPPQRSRLPGRARENREGPRLGQQDQRHPDAPETLRGLAGAMGPLAAKSAARAEADFAEPDEAYTARARANWETYIQVSAPNGSWDYRYPGRYVGETAASQPRPSIEPEPEAEP